MVERDLISLSLIELSYFDQAQVNVKPILFLEFCTIQLSIVEAHSASLSLLKLINNSSSQNKGNHYRGGGLKMWS